MLWLWGRLAATAPIPPLAWEPTYAAGAALEKATKQNKTKQKRQKKKKTLKKTHPKKASSGAQVLKHRSIHFCMEWNC